MKVGWQKKKIADVCRLMTGGTPSKSKPEFFGGNIKWLVSGDIHMPEIFDCEGRLSEAGRKASNAKFLPANSVMIALNGQGKTRGTVALLRTQATCNQSLVCITPNESKNLLPEYLYFNLQGRYQELRQMTGDSGNDRRGLNMGLINDIEIPIAPPAEQQRIVSILEEAFKGIATAQANAKKNLHSAGELFSLLLNEMLSTADRSWQQLAFGDVVTRSRGGVNIKSTDYCVEGIPVLTKGDVKPFGVVEHGGKCVSEIDKQAQAWPRSSPGDFIVTTRDLKPSAPFLGLVGRVPLDKSYVVNQGATLFAIDESRVAPEYFLYWCSSNRFREHVRSKRVGSTQVHIRQGDLFSAPLWLPSMTEQLAIVAKLNEVADQTKQLATVNLRRLSALDELKKSLLHQAFTGQLTATESSLATPRRELQTTTPQFAANIISLAYARHAKKQRERTFGRVKEQKLLHLVETIAKIDLGRRPMKDAAGPNDFQHMLKAEDWARTQGFFEMVDRGNGYDFKELKDFDKHLQNARQELAPHLSSIEKVIDLLIPMDSEEAGVFATVHAAWNNLLIDGIEATDGAILKEARETWHADKLSIPEHKFKKAIEFIRRNGLIPDGTGKYVAGQTSLL